MSDSDKMRDEFEKWADFQCLSLARIDWKDGTVSDYAYTATLHAWRVWQAAYAAGQKAEREKLESLLPRAVKEGLKIVAEGER